MLSAKRLMTDDVPTGGGAKPRQEQMGSTNVAFIETGWRLRGCPLIWYCCGKRCNPEGWRECPNVTKDQRDKVAVLVKKGHFFRGGHFVDNKDDASTASVISTKSSSVSGKKISNKKGAAFVAIEEESVGEDKEAEDLPTYE